MATRTCAYGVDIVARERTMTVVCAWCQREGRKQVLREKEPFDYRAVSHGICEEHSRTFLAEVREAKTAVTTLGRREP
jgi:hypothetical protein